MLMDLSHQETTICRWKMYCNLEILLVLYNASLAVFISFVVSSCLCLVGVCVNGRLGVQELGYLVVSHFSSDCRNRNNDLGLSTISRE